jgi:RsiW-degrading membrane proteinase PrsW (M82 family)
LHRDSLLHVPIRERDGNKSEGAAVLTDPRYDAVLAGSLLRRRGMRIVTGAVLLVVLAFAAVIQLSALVNMRSDIAGVFLKALFLSSFLTIVPIAVLWFLDRREREGTWLFDAAFLWGGFIATALSLPFNNAFFQLVDDWVAQNPAITGVLGPDAAAMIAAPISAPIVEEIAKALGVLAIFWVARAEFDGMRDGFVYGAAVGVGFNWSEAALYVAQGYAESGVAPYGTELGARYALFGLGGHALFTGMLGLCLGLAVQTNRRWLRVLAPIIGIVLAIAAHRLINSLPLRAALEQARTGVPVDSHQGPAEAGFLDAFLRGSINQLAILLPFMLMTALALWRSGVWERRVIREELGSEIGRAVTPGEYEGIAQDDILRTRRVSGMQRGASSALVKAQNELAFRKRRVRADGKTPSTIILSDDGEKRSSACGNCRHEAPIPAPPSGEMGSAAGPSD